MFNTGTWIPCCQKSNWGNILNFSDWLRHTKIEKTRQAFLLCQQLLGKHMEKGENAGANRISTIAFDDKSFNPLGDISESMGFCGRHRSRSDCTERAV